MPNVSDRKRKPTDSVDNARPKRSTAGKRKHPVHEEPDEVISQSDDEEEEDIDDIACKVCNRRDGQNKMLLCDGCDAGYHLHCLQPVLTAIPEGDWYCCTCKAEGMRLPEGDAAAGDVPEDAKQKSDGSESDEGLEELAHTPVRSVRKDSLSKRVPAQPSAKPKASKTVQQYAPVEVDATAEPKQQAQIIIDALTKWSADGLKCFVRHLKQMSTTNHYGRPCEVYPFLPLGKREQLLEDLTVVVQSAIILGGPVERARHSSFYESTPQFTSQRITSERIRNVCIEEEEEEEKEAAQSDHSDSEKVEDSDEIIIKIKPASCQASGVGGVGGPPAPERWQSDVAFLKAFSDAQQEFVALCASKAVSKNRSGEAKQVQQLLPALEKAQLVALLIAAMDAHPEVVSTIEDALPPPDVEPTLKNCQKLVNAIFRAMPNSRFGSSRDDFCQRRCAGHVSAAKAALVKPIAQYRSAKRWDVVLKYAERALVMATEIPVWNNTSKNGPRDAAVSALTKLKAEAEAKI
mmetsp:Transcript_24324/g.40740  ORF Transcript_24324/g.40740 Transcript_24324/m.40740 type:complete len:519 (-) Transcript_24324:288-1844(-)|eukprot:CAMPEP_0198205694 /NCGR_PEP_ID=MMETSP1445-20131203/9233_1 /TAXON_ID=36898 /ORGANISM="Pyramimonas sp., Strain CCMP2087" /LENGTH=518 /DNA_ID=CAMNT_0043878091 /DNA_START=63 /DNA_END=1619 /DNA_ORIENTATION=-